MLLPVNATCAHAEFRDIDLFHEAHSENEPRAVQLDAGTLSFAVDELAFPDLALHRLSLNRAIDWHFCLPQGWTSYALTPSANHPQTLWCGSVVLPDVLAIMRSGREHQTSLPAGWCDFQIVVSETLSFDYGIAPEQLLERSMAPELGRLPLPAPFAARLRAKLGALLSDTETLRTACDNPYVAHRMRLMLMDELTRAVEHGLSAGLTTSRIAVRRRYRLVRRALELLDDPEAEILYAEQLGQTLGASNRSLQRAFRDVFGVAPYQYLLLKRLSDAHTELKSRKAHLSISELAAEYGFCSASEFSRHYKRVFGELPSATLHAKR